MVGPIDACGTTRQEQKAPSVRVASPIALKRRSPAWTVLVALPVRAESFPTLAVRPVSASYSRSAVRILSLAGDIRILTLGIFVLLVGNGSMVKR